MSQDYHNDYQPEAFQGVDLDKLKNIVRRSLPWLLLIFILTNLSAYLIIRWTKPLYVSDSEIKLDIKTNASELGIGFVENQNLNMISGEIELLKSRLFFSQVIDALDLSTSYYTIGKVLNDEKYKSSPFEVEAFVKVPQALDRRFYVDFKDEKQFYFSLTEDFSDQKLYNYGDIVETPLADFKIKLTRSFDQSVEFRHFFILNSKEALLSYIDKNLSVEPVNLNANTIRISFQDHNQLKAYDMVSAIDTMYLRFSQEEKLQENKQKIEYLNHQLFQIENLLENYEDYFESFTLKYRTSDLNADLKQTLIFINALDSQQYVLEKKLKAVDETYKQLVQKEELVSVNPRTTYLPDQIKEKISALNELIRERNKLRLFYNESTLAYTRKEQELTSIINSLSEELLNLRQQIRDNIEELVFRRQKLENTFSQIPEQTTEYNKKQRFFKLYEEFYLSLMQTKAEFEIAQAGTTPDFKILSPANMPLAPVSPNKLIIHGIGLVSGFVLGLLFLSLRYVLNNKINSISELETLTNSAILGSVPSFGGMNPARMVIQDEPRSAVSESLRTIRTNIEFMLAGKTNKILSVTSTVGGEGKTFIATNLSAIISLSKRKVVVLDLDLRKPKVHEAMGEENSAKGVSTILINKHSIEDCIRPTGVNNLDYIPAGPTPPNPSELLLNGEFNTLLDDLSKLYDIIVLDTPPVGIVTDGILAMRKAVLPIYVFRANYSQKEFLKVFKRVQQINNIKNLAVILNAVPQGADRYYGAGYYEEKKGNKAFGKIKMIFNRV
ncbi:MAG: GumC family protein [Candidatus Cyclobacteriaceae bacterium M2_1C_046]